MRSAAGSYETFTAGAYLHTPTEVELQRSGMFTEISNGEALDKRASSALERGEYWAKQAAAEEEAVREKTALLGAARLARQQPVEIQASLLSLPHGGEVIPWPVVASVDNGH